MEKIALQDLSRNAFRVLGLSGGASQIQIETAARLLLVEQPVGDIDWLGPINREPAQIQSALVRLTDHSERLKDRIWWFCGSAPANAAEAAVRESIARTNDLAQHDAVIIRLGRQLLAGKGADLLAWEPVLWAADRLQESASYRAWLELAEAAGDFEKCCTPQEMAVAHLGMAVQLASTFAALGEHALATNDAQSLRIVLRILKGSSCKSVWKALLDRIDEAVEIQCDQMRATAEASTRRKRSREVVDACRGLLQKYDRRDAPMLAVLLQQSESRLERERVCCSVSAVLEFIAEMLFLARDYTGALDALARALSAAIGTPREIRIREEHDKLQRLLNQG